MESGAASQATVLIVDDNPKIFHSLRLNLNDSGYAAAWARDGAEALDYVANHPVSLVLLDLSLGSENGLDVLEAILARLPELPVIMITGYGTFEAAVQSIKIGAYHFLPKPLDFGKLESLIDKAIRKPQPDPGEAEGDDPFLRETLITSSPAVLAAYRKAKMLSQTDLPILINGESGCGKELFVKFIHAHSARSGEVLRQINCSAYPDTLIDNELFGHEKGAYTGADAVHEGLFEQADRGTLHLDEIADMSLPSQAKLLRVLEDGIVHRLGGAAGRKVDVRILASTNKNLPKLVESGKFREDLFYRLNAVFLYLPPVRERKGDLPLLLRHFAGREPGGARKWFSAEALEMLHSYDWPGNVREIKNTVAMCVAITQGAVIQAESLPESIQSRSGRPAETAHTLDQTEKEHIIRILKESKFNKKRASQRLGISRKTLYNKLKTYDIE